MACRIILNIAFPHSDNVPEPESDYQPNTDLLREVDDYFTAPPRLDGEGPTVPPPEPLPHTITLGEIGDTQHRQGHFNPH